MTTPVLTRRRLLAVAAALLIAPSPTLAQSDGDGRGRYCSATALTQDEACQHQIMDAYFIARTKCTNLSDRNETTPIEPDAYHHKYYAPGVGFILEVNPKTAEFLQLVGCNFDPRCASLPAVATAAAARKQTR